GRRSRVRRRSVAVRAWSQPVAQRGGERGLRGSRRGESLGAYQLRRDLVRRGRRVGAHRPPNERGARPELGLARAVGRARGFVGYTLARSLHLLSAGERLGRSSLSRGV